MPDILKELRRRNVFRVGYYPIHDLIAFGEAWFINDPRARKAFEEDGRQIAYWRTHTKPDFCYGGFESWICELKPEE